MKEITMETKISELLNSSDEMKDILISINPKFKKLNNPILRRTLAKVATIKQAAFVGGMEPTELLNKLREAVGQTPLEDSNIKDETRDIDTKEPEWIHDQVKATLDANKLLDEEKNPLAEANLVLKDLKEDEIVVIKSDFEPKPLIDEFEKKNLKVFCKKLGDEAFATYIKR